MVLEVNNSFSHIKECSDPRVKDLVREVLTYENDFEHERGQLFYQLSQAKRFNQRERARTIQARLKYLEDNRYTCWLKDNSFPTGHLEIVKEALKTLNCVYEIHDLRKPTSGYAMLRWKNQPPEPRYYQREMIRLGVEHGRGVFEASVGSGKSIVLAYLIKHFDVNSLVVVPTRGLSDQLYNDLSRWFGHEKVEMIDAAKVRRSKKLKPIRIVTLQSLGSLKKSGDLTKLVSDLDAIHYDEYHHSAAGTWVNIIQDLDHIYYRFGYTGTFMRNDNKVLDLWAFLSNALYEYPAWKAIDDGYLTPIEVIVHELPGIYNQDYQKEYDNCYCGNPALLQEVSDICVNSDDQILILVNKKEKSGHIVNEYLNTLGIANTYISGDDDKEEITETIRSFNDKRIRVLVGSSVIAEGIDVRSTTHLINLKGGKSEIVLVQAVGRAVRLSENKPVAYVHEFFFSGTRYMEKHFRERIQSIENNFRPKSITSVP